MTTHGTSYMQQWQENEIRKASGTVTFDIPPRSPDQAARVAKSFQAINDARSYEQWRNSLRGQVHEVIVDLTKCMIVFAALVALIGVVLSAT